MLEEDVTTIGLPVVLQSIADYLLSLVRRRRIIEYVRAQTIEGCKDLFLMHEEAIRASKRFYEVYESLFEGKARKPAYCKEAAKNAVKYFNEFLRCLLESLANQLEYLRELALKDAEFSVLFAIAMVYSENGYLDLDRLAYGWPHAFKMLMQGFREAFSKACKDLAEEKARLKALVRRDAKRCLRSIMIGIDEEIERLPIRFGPKSRELFFAHLRSLLEEECLYKLLRALK